MLLKLALPKAPDWIELIPGIRIFSRPVTRVEQAAARAFAKRKQGELAENGETIRAIGGEAIGLPTDLDPDRKEAISDLLYAQGVGRQCIIKWEGIIDDDGKPAECTQEAIDLFMRQPYVADLYLQRVQEQLSLLFTEGGGLPVDVNGTIQAGQDIVGGAKSKTSPAAEESMESTESDASTSKQNSELKKDGKPGH